MTMQALEHEYWELLRSVGSHLCLCKILPNMDAAFEVYKFHLFVVDAHLVNYQKHLTSPVGVGIIED